MNCMRSESAHDPEGGWANFFSIIDIFNIRFQHGSLLRIINLYSIERIIGNIIIEA